MAILLKVTLFLAVICFCNSQRDDSRNARILKYDFFNKGLGPYYFSFLTSDGIRRLEEGELKEDASRNQILVVRGEYAYTGPNGVVYSVRYTADENGFHANIEQGQSQPYDHNNILRVDSSTSPVPDEGQLPASRLSGRPKQLLTDEIDLNSEYSSYAATTLQSSHSSRTLGPYNTVPIRRKYSNHPTVPNRHRYIATKNKLKSKRASPFFINSFFGSR